jgi:type I restriction enzyme S subunit
MKKVKFGEVAQFINGMAFKPSDWGFEGLPIIRIQNLTGTNETFNYFSGEYQNKYLVSPGDILISWSASLGVFKWHGPQAVLNQHIFKVDVKPNVDSQYFYYTAINALETMKKEVHGSTMQHITKDRFDNLEILLPSLDEQRRIARILDQADRLRQLRRHARQLTDTFLQSVFIEMFEKNKGHWERSAVQEVSKKIIDCKHYTPQYSDKGIPLIKTNDTTPGFFKFGNTVLVSPEDYSKLTDVNVPQKGDIVFAREGSFGVASYINENRPYAIGQRTMIIRADSSKIDPIFLTYYINGPTCQKLLLQISMGTTVKRVNVGDVKDLQVFLPPIELQKSFAEIALKNNFLQEQLLEAERQAELNFQALLHQAFTGQLSLKGQVAG